MAKQAETAGDQPAVKRAVKKTAAKPAAKKAAGALKPAVKKAAAAKPVNGRGKSLVIVESPAKARTIEKYLGAGFKVLASVGHVRDLPESKLGVDIEQDFAPEYVTIRGKKPVLDALKKASEGVDTVYLATDPDREGEAIAWHVAEYLKLKDKQVYRATFNEITKQAVREAIDNPSQINEALCMAQQSRRILDRLVGYQISPLLWKNVQRGLSAGRVQSVAVRLLCEREAQIEAFRPEEYWTIEAGVAAAVPPPFVVKLAKVGGEKARIGDEAGARAVVAAVEGQPFIVSEVLKKPVRRNPQPPFITSTLQQEAARKLRMSPKQAMAVAQGLYEGVSLGSEGPVGLITYMRTDSVRVSDSALEGVRSFIRTKYGERYLPEKPRVFASRKGAQDAHEAIRPTLLDRPPETLTDYLDSEQLALYRLVWDRFVASQMAAAQIEQTTIEVPVAERYLFTATGSVVQFQGFLAIYEEGKDDGEESEGEGEAAGRLPQVAPGERLTVDRITPGQHFTQPPTRFSMSSLIRELERRGIGRPSTYAAILTTIQEKKYAERVEGFFRPTDLGRMVTRILVDSFPEILDVQFTAGMEAKLDEIEDGTLPWLQVMREFYQGFSERLAEAQVSMSSPRGEEEQTDLSCSKCGSPMVIKWGRNGHFLACSNYPECKNTMPFSKDETGQVVAESLPETDEKCDKCGAPFVVKNSKRGHFLACSAYPECKNSRPIAELKDGKAVAAAALPETTEVCEKCGKPMLVKNGRRGPFLACSGYPKCRNAKNIAQMEDGKAVAEAVPQTDEVCEKCKSPMVVKTGKRGPFLACTGFPKCRNAKPLPADHPAVLEAKSRPAGAKVQSVETEIACEKCGKMMVLRKGRFGPFLSCPAYPKCKTTMKTTPEILEKYPLG